MARKTDLRWRTGVSNRLLALAISWVWVLIIIVFSRPAYNDPVELIKVGMSRNLDDYKITRSEEYEKGEP